MDDKNDSAAQSPEEALRRLKEQMEYLERRGLMETAETLRKRNRDKQKPDFDRERARR